MKTFLWSVKYPNQPVFYVRPHREDGPAIIWPDGTEFYKVHGQLHREDGPAEIYPNGDVFWHFNDKDYSFNEWCSELNKTPEEISDLKLKWNVP